MATDINSLDDDAEEKNSAASFSDALKDNDTLEDPATATDNMSKMVNIMASSEIDEPGLEVDVAVMTDSSMGPLMSMKEKVQNGKDHVFKVPKSPLKSGFIEGPVSPRSTTMAASADAAADFSGECNTDTSEMTFTPVGDPNSGETNFNGSSMFPLSDPLAPPMIEFVAQSTRLIGDGCDPAGGVDCQKGKRRAEDECVPGQLLPSQWTRTTAPLQHVALCVVGADHGQALEQQEEKPRNHGEMAGILAEIGDFTSLMEDPCGKSEQEMENASLGNDNWARNRFNNWRIAQGLNDTRRIEDIPFPELGTLLSKFFMQVCNMSGKRYPAASIMNLFFAYNRILVREQQLRIKLTGVMEPTFKIQTHPDFIAAGKAVQYAMAKSRYDGVHAEPKMFSDEQKILDHPNYQKNTAPGCQKRFAYYCLTVFLIRGSKDMWSLLFKDFRLGKDEEGCYYLEYNGRLSKGHKASASLLEDEPFKPVYSHDTDVISTFRTLAEHFPPLAVDGHLFLTVRIESRSVIWFKKGVNVSEGMIRSWFKDMAEITGLGGYFLNQSGRSTAMTRWVMAGVPEDVIAGIREHRKKKTVEQDPFKSLQQKAAQIIARNPYDEYFNLLTYETVLNREIAKQHAQDNMGDPLEYQLED